MLSEDTVKTISNLFIGDIGNLFSYKRGYDLVKFFNRYYTAGDRYEQGFPSRWVYVYNKLVELLNNNRFDTFLNIILNKEFIMQDRGLSQVEAAEHIETIYNELNVLVQKDMYIITRAQGKYHLCSQDEDLKYHGGGGFANVYVQKSTGHILKKLKDDFLTNEGIRSRFKREYEITKSLQDVFGIIQVYKYDSSTCSYTMERAEKTLEEYVKKETLSDNIKVTCIRQILYIMTEVHKRNVIHRDLSPNNIFVVNGMLKIADFGLGKDLNVFTSHQTIHTNAVGQYSYCAPEQFMLLKDGDKRSDVYSLGRIINFIMTGSPINSHHIFRSVSEKATNSDSAYRYADAGHLSDNFEKSVKFHKDAKNEETIFGKMASKVFDSDVEAYIYELNAEKISQYLLESKSGILNTLISFMKCDDSHAQYIVQSVESTFRDVCGYSFAANDPFATFAYRVLKGDFTFVVKEIAATILRYIATDVNRFHAQRLVEELKKDGLEPMIEDILDS